MCPSSSLDYLSSWSRNIKTYTHPSSTEEDFKTRFIHLTCQLLAKHATLHDQQGHAATDAAVTFSEADTVIRTQNLKGFPERAQVASPLYLYEYVKSGKMQ